MSSRWLLLAFAAPLLAQPPAAYEEPQILYRLEPGPRLTEARTGVIRLDSTELASTLRRIVLPKLNAAGTATLRYLALVRGDREIPTADPSLETTRSAFVWNVAEAQVGDRIRFSTEQPVDFTNNTAGGRIDAVRVRRWSRTLSLVRVTKKAAARVRR